MPVFQYQPLAETLLPPELPPLPWLSGNDVPPPVRARAVPPDFFQRIEPVAPPAPDFSGGFESPRILFRVHLPETEPTAILLPALVAPSRWSPYGPTFSIAEKGTGTYRAQLVASDGVTPLPGTVLQGLTLTLYTIGQLDETTIVNGRNKQNVLNQNNVSISTSGLVSWQIQPGDTTLIDPALPFERHIALLEWSWARGAGKKEVILVVRNLRRVS
jgi:hypothetical protein